NISWNCRKYSVACSDRRLSSSPASVLLSAHNIESPFLGPQGASGEFVRDVEVHERHLEAAPKSSSATVCSPILRTVFLPFAFSTLFIRDFSLQKHVYAGGS